MFCPKCGKINPDDGERCSGCGAALREEANTPPAAKKGKAWKIILTAVLALVVICIVVFLLSGCSGGTVNPNEKVLF